MKRWLIESFSFVALALLALAIRLTGAAEGPPSRDEWRAD